MSATSLTYRPMTSQDVPVIFEITLNGSEKSFTREGLDSAGITEASTAAMMDVARSHQGWVCEDGNKIVGFAMGNATTGECWVVVVRPEYGRQGIGSKLYALTEEWLLSLGWKEVWLGILQDVQKMGYAFFRKKGFVDNGMNGAWRLMKKTT